MKKRILILFAMLVGILLFGCEDKENTAFRSDIIDLLDRLSIHAEDIDDLSYGESLYEGKANLIIYEEDYSKINLIQAEEESVILAVFDVGERSLNYCDINYVDIDYINYDKNLRLTLTFYKTYLFSDTYRPEKIHFSAEDFKSGLTRLSLKDWEYILKELGY